MIRWRSPSALALVLTAFLSGCTSTPDEPQASDPPRDPVVERTPPPGRPDAPPFGVPRAKLAPGEVLEDEAR